MELRQLEYFCKIADTGSINEAARRLNMSQPPLSYQLRQLEEELESLLFIRTGKGVELTEAGELLYSRAKSLLNYADSMRKEVTETGKKRVLRMGITSTTVSTLMPYITRFVQKFPEASFEVRDGATFELFQLLLDGIIDISVARTPLRLDDVESLELVREPMIVALPRGSYDDGDNGMKIENLNERPLILYRRYEKMIVDAFAENGVKPNVFCVCDDARDAVMWVDAGLATAVFPQSMRSVCRGLRVKRLDEPALETKTLLIWKKGGRMPAAAKDFLDICFKSKG